MADRILIRDLEVYWQVGVPDEERAVPQRLLLTVEMEHDFTAAAAADELAGTLDYHAVYQRVLSWGQGRSWKLIETLAVDVANLVLTEFGARRVAVEVAKFILPLAREVRVRVERGGARAE